MKEDFVTKETTRIAAVAELERVIRQMREESIKVKVNLETQEKAIQVYLDQMERNQQTPTELPHPFFSCPTLLHLQTQIVEFGEVREWELDYSLKKQPILAVGKEGKAFLQFGKKDYELVRRTGTYGGGGEGQLYYPRGLCIDYNGDVYVAESGNDRVSVFSKELNVLKHLGTQQLKHPLDVKVTPNLVVVLDSSPNCIHFFSRSGDLIRSFVTQGKDGMVYCPEFFCLDPAGNILISAHLNNSIKILSPSGQLIQKIGKRGHGRGELYIPCGICLSETGNIFVISHNINFGLQSF